MGQALGLQQVLGSQMEEPGPEVGGGTRGQGHAAYWCRVWTSLIWHPGQVWRLSHWVLYCWQQPQNRACEKSCWWKPMLERHLLHGVDAAAAVSLAGAKDWR